MLLSKADGYLQPGWGIIYTPKVSRHDVETRFATRSLDLSQFLAMRYG